MKRYLYHIYILDIYSYIICIHICVDETLIALDQPPGENKEEKLAQVAQGAHEGPAHEGLAHKGYV